MKTIPFLFLTLFPCLLCASLIAPDVPINLRKVDPKSGKVKWSVQLPRDETPYRCEAYPGRIVVYLWEKKWEEDEAAKRPRSHILFLNSETGRRARPFDTRDFVYDFDDPMIASAGSKGSILDERNELHLANGWVSSGVGGLPWWNTGSNTVYFMYCRQTPQWSINLPEDAYNLMNWSNVLVFRQMIEQEQTSIAILFGQFAGANTPTWEFRLPADVPDMEVHALDVMERLPRKTRYFDYAIGQLEIFVFGGGTLFALDPSTGKTLWRRTVSGDPVIRNNSIYFQHGAILEVRDDLILFSHNPKNVFGGDAMVRFSKISQTVTAALRKDLYWGRIALYCDGYIYCCTVPAGR